MGSLTEDHATAEEAETAALKKRGDISELLIRFREESPVSIIRTLAENASPRKRADANTQARIDEITERKATVEKGKIKISVTVDPGKARGVGKYRDTQEAYPGEDKDRQDVTDRAIEQAQAEINATMWALDKIRVPYMIPKFNGEHRASVTIMVNEHDFERAVKPLRELPPTADDNQKAAAAEKFWGEEGHEDRPVQRNGYPPGSATAVMNKERSTLPSLAAIVSK